MTEFRYKQERIFELLHSRHIDSLLLQRTSSFAWATCGAASYVNTASTTGGASLLVTPSGNHLITTNIEATRLEQEEKLTYQGWQIHSAPWFDKNEIIKKIIGKQKLGADSIYPGAMDLSVDIARLRARLTPEEGVRFRVLGRLCADAMDRAARSIQPGMTEHQIASILAKETLSKGVQAIVNLVATDERIFSYRHPIPTYKALENYAMLVLCGRRWGLVCSITRLIYFGTLPEDIKRKAEAVAKVDAVFISSTRPGMSLGAVFEQAKASYTASGYPDEWRLHHQGGPAGYEPREYLALPGSSELVYEGQVYAWNPSITGVKSEDSIQVGNQGNEIITVIPDWPTIPVEIDNQSILRPWILEVT